MKLETLLQDEKVKAVIKISGIERVTNTPERTVPYTQSQNRKIPEPHRARMIKHLHILGKQLQNVE